MSSNKTPHFRLSCVSKQPTLQISQCILNQNWRWKKYLFLWERCLHLKYHFTTFISIMLQVGERKCNDEVPFSNVFVVLCFLVIAFHELKIKIQRNGKFIVGCRFNIYRVSCMYMYHSVSPYCPEISTDTYKHWGLMGLTISLDWWSYLRVFIDATASPSNEIRRTERVSWNPFSRLVSLGPVCSMMHRVTVATKGWYVAEIVSMNDNLKRDIATRQLRRSSASKRPYGWHSKEKLY